MRRALSCLSLLLLSAGTPYVVHAIPRRPVITFTARVVETTPYLPINGAPPLRFAEAMTIAKTANSQATLSNPTTQSATESAATSGSTSASAASGVTSPALTDALTGSETATTKDSTTPAAKSPAPILQDEARPIVRPEDFLPYFQIPGSARHPGDVTLIVPAVKAPPTPGTLPPSSATYTQTPK